MGTSLYSWYAHCPQTHRKENMDAGLLLCCTGPGGCHSQMEKPWEEKIKSMFVMGKWSVRDKAGGERSPWPAYIASEGVSRESLAAEPLASSRLENDYELSKTQGLGKDIFFSRFWDSYFPLSIPVLQKYFKLAPVCSQWQPMLHIFHVPHFENVTQNCHDPKCKFNFETGRNGL